jgi:AraC-like DNA-binding protein
MTVPLVLTCLFSVLMAGGFYHIKLEMTKNEWEMNNLFFLHRAKEQFDYKIIGALNHLKHSWNREVFVQYSGISNDKYEVDERWHLMHTEFSKDGYRIDLINPAYEWVATSYGAMDKNVYLRERGWLESDLVHWSGEKILLAKVVSPSHGNYFLDDIAIITKENIAGQPVIFVITFLQESLLQELEDDRSGGLALRYRQNIITGGFWNKLGEAEEEWISEWGDRTDSGEMKRNDKVYSVDSMQSEVLEQASLLYAAPIAARDDTKRRLLRAATVILILSKATGAAISMLLTWRLRIPRNGRAGQAELTASSEAAKASVKVKREDYCNKAADDELIGRLIEFIHSRYSEDIALPDLANYVERSPSYISHMFKLRTGINFKEYLNRYRVMKAKELLEDGVGVGKTAASVGCGNSNTFGRIFKKYEGVSPAQYMEKQKNVKNKGDFKKNDE